MWDTIVDVCGIILTAKVKHRSPNRQPTGGIRTHGRSCPGLVRPDKYWAGLIRYQFAQLTSDGTLCQCWCSHQEPASFNFGPQWSEYHNFCCCNNNPLGYDGYKLGEQSREHENTGVVTKIWAPVIWTPGIIISGPDTQISVPWAYNMPSPSRPPSILMVSK